MFRVAASHDPVWQCLYRYFFLPPPRTRLNADVVNSYFWRQTVCPRTRAPRAVGAIHFFLLGHYYTHIATTPIRGLNSFTAVLINPVHSPFGKRREKQRWSGRELRRRDVFVLSVSPHNRRVQYNDNIITIYCIDRL